MRIFYLVGFVLMFGGCSKSSNTLTGNGSTFIKYKINGETVQMSGSFSSYTSTLQGVYAIKQLKSPGLGLPNTRYALAGILGANRQIQLSIVTDSLSNQTYQTTSYVNPQADISNFCFIKHDSTQFANIRNEDVMSINISRYSRGTIDGTFSGKLSWFKANSSPIVYVEASVTEGSFQNVQVVY